MAAQCAKTCSNTVYLVCVQKNKVRQKDDKTSSAQNYFYFKLIIFINK